MPSSADMLVYTRRRDPSGAPADPEPAPPPLAQFTVEKLDKAYHKEVEDWLDRYVRAVLLRWRKLTDAPRQVEGG